MPELTLWGMMQFNNNLMRELDLPDALDEVTLVDQIVMDCGELYPQYQSPFILERLIHRWFTRRKPEYKHIIDAITKDYNPIHNYDRIEDATDTSTGSAENTSSGTDTMTSTPKVSTTTSHEGTDKVDYSGSDDVKHTGNDTLSNTGTQQQTNSTNGTDAFTHDVSAFDSSALQTDYKDSTTYGKGENGTRTDNLQAKTDYNDTVTNSYDSTDTNTYNSKIIETKDGSDVTETEYGKKVAEKSKGKNVHAAHIYGNVGVTTSQQMILAEIDLRAFDIYKMISREFEKQFIMRNY